MRKYLTLPNYIASTNARIAEPVKHIILFLVTFLTCTIAGAQWAAKDFTEVSNWIYGLEYAILILTFLSAHEFAHYFAARRHGVDCTLPYYIPFPIPYTLNFGTFGAVIRTRSAISSRKALFDIGASGPIAGFIVCVIFLAAGFATLPPSDYLFSIHPEYRALLGGRIPETGLTFGLMPLFEIMKDLFAPKGAFIPPPNEIFHYPLLNVGWFGLFVTSLNLLPIGQLDGGHIVYSIFKKTHHRISVWSWRALTLIGLLSVLAFLYEFISFDTNYRYVFYVQSLLNKPLIWLKMHLPWTMTSWAGWLVWAAMLKFVTKLRHPPVYDLEDIGAFRKALGLLCLIILALSFSWQGLYFAQ